MFADTLIEDPDLYRFLDDVERDLAVPITRLADGRTPWDVFDDVGMIGNTRADPCSRILKRELLWQWIETNCDVQDTTVILGIDWTEMHRLERTRLRREPWVIRAPLCEPPLIDKADLLVKLRTRGIEPPSLYRYGFPHNNCGGFCIKAGKAQFALLLRTFPDRYAIHEERERQFRERTGKNVAILRDRRGGVTRPETLERWRIRLSEGESAGDEWGGCGCALDD